MGAPPVPSNPCCHWSSQPCHHVPSMPPAPRTWLWGSQWGCVTPGWVGGSGQGALPGSHGSRSSVSPPCREGSSRLEYLLHEIMGCRNSQEPSAAAAGGDASRGHRGEVAAGDGPGAPHPCSGLRSLGDTWGPLCGAGLALAWDVFLGAPSLQPCALRGCPAVPGGCEVSPPCPGHAVPHPRMCCPIETS